jgi:hypothetical protein
VPPDFANSEVRVTVESSPADRNGVPARPVSAEEWREFVKRTAGSIPDFPEVERPGPDSYENRGDW